VEAAARVRRGEDEAGDVVAQAPGGGQRGLVGDLVPRCVRGAHPPWHRLIRFEEPGPGDRLGDVCEVDDASGRCDIPALAQDRDRFAGHRQSAHDTLHFHETLCTQQIQSATHR
jgi:hypothetical protein